MCSCTFVGHHDCSSDVRDKLYKTIEDLIVNNNVRVFFVGTHGSFDRIVYSVLCELELIYKIRFTVVLAYRPSHSDSVYYDMAKTVYPCELDSVPYRFAINKRNEYMFERSDYLVCCVDHSQSNASKFVKYAQAKNLKIINIGKLKIRENQ